MELSIVIPAYNEEKRIIKTLEKYYTFFQKKLGNNFEIIIVPNNCIDNTLKVVEKFSEGKKNIIIIDISNYIGKGGAVMKGFQKANGKLIGFVDADNSTNPENFFKLVENINNFDGIISSRKIKGAKIEPKRSFFQNFSSFLFNFWVRVLFSLDYKDTQCGAKLFKKDIAKYLSDNISETGWAFDVDILYLCKKRSFRIKEYPIFWSDCEGSKLTLFDGINSFMKLIKYKINN